MTQNCVCDWRLRRSSDRTCNKTVNCKTTPPNLKILMKLESNNFRAIGKLALQIRKSISRGGNVKYIPSVCADSTTSIFNLNMRGPSPGKLINHGGNRASTMSNVTSGIQQHIFATAASNMRVQPVVRSESLPTIIPPLRLIIRMRY